jgi:hypothetical protein
MNRQGVSGTRRTFRWPGEARELVRVHLEGQRIGRREIDSDNKLRELVSKLEEASGNPRDACWRFARHSGIVGKREYHAWPEGTRQKLLDLIGVQPLRETAFSIRRSPASVRSMLYRLGASAKMGRDWFTKSVLADALHIRVGEVERWIKLGWLKSRLIHAGALKREIIDADDFSDFCKRHTREVVGRRLNSDRLAFVRTFVFPPSHADLLSVRESKKERAAYHEQKGNEAGVAGDQNEGDEDLGGPA